MSFSSTTFAESLQPDSLTADDPINLERRLKTYSVEALRAAAVIERVYVKHTQFSIVISALDRLFQLGTELETPHGFRLVGPSGVGKSAAYAYFRRSLPASTFFDHPSAALSIRIPKRAHMGVMIKALLRALEYPFAEGTYRQLYSRRCVVADALKSKGTRLLWLDEAHHLIWRRSSGEFRQQEGDASEFLRELVDECRVGVVLAGSSELDDLPVALPHLASRVPGRLVMDPFELDPAWAGFINAFSISFVQLDLQPINSPAIMTMLHKSTGGNLRLFRQLMIESVLLSVDAKNRVLEIDVLRRAYELVMGASTRSNPFV